MRIVYLHQYFNTPAMAGGTRSYEMARRFVRAGHEVHVVTSERERGGGAGSGWRETEEEGVRVHWIPVPYSNRMSLERRMRAFLRFAWLSARRAAELAGDVVFATSTPLTIALPGVYAARRCRVPMVFEVRDLWPELPIRLGALRSPLSIGAARRLERFAYRNAERVVALSPGMKAGVVAAGYPAERVAVIPNSCDLELFDVGPEPGRALRRRFEWLGDRPLVIYTGTLGQINGVSYLARVAAEAHRLDPEVRFLVLGGGKEEERVRETARALGVLERNFFMRGEVPKAEVPAWLSAADVATSLFIDVEEMWANSANKFFDALSAGRPVAINYGGWQAELLAESGAGIRLDARDHRLAAEQIVRAARDARWKAEAGEAARGLARERFDRDLLARQLERVLAEAAAAGTGRAR